MSLVRASGERTPPRPYYSTPAVPWLVVVSSTRLVTTTKEEVLQYVLRTTTSILKVNKK